MKQNTNTYTCSAVMPVVLLLTFMAILNLASCKKYLDVKPLKTDAVPNSLKDLQSLLDNESKMNSNSPALLEILSDNYFISTAEWDYLMANTLENEALNYRWDKKAIPFDDSWIKVYQNPIYVSNIVLDYLEKVKYNSTESEAAEKIRGAALFFRAFAYFELAQLFCKPYNSSTADSDLGLALKLSSDINESVKRISVKNSYDQILMDLKAAAHLLPNSIQHALKPTKIAAYGELARVYLSMREYDSAWNYSNLALSLYSDLVDYNTLIPVSFPPIPSFNREIIFHCIASPSNILAPEMGKIDSVLYNSYNDKDLRKVLFFQANSGDFEGTYNFQGSYHGSYFTGYVFTGITTSELFLIRAECYARKGMKSEAITDLNTLMQKRWTNNEWIPFEAADNDEALSIILSERRKELVYRNSRWTDLRRFNLEGRDITLHREINGVEYKLPPNDLRWVNLIPFDVIKFSGIDQNIR